MKLTKKLNELINSGLSLSDKELELVESYILSKSAPVKTSHLAHYQCIAAIRDKGSDKQSY